MTDRSSRLNRRRSRPARTIDQTIPSPCVAVCRYDGQPHCVGCFRDQDEIRDWMIMTREQKLIVLDNIAERRRIKANSSS